MTKLLLLVSLVLSACVDERPLPDPVDVNADVTSCTLVRNTHIVDAECYDLQCEGFPHKVLCKDTW